MSYITSYQPQNISFTHGKGVYLYDNKGREYLDALSGIAVTGLGHAHPQITEVICEQARKLIHTSNVYTIENQLKLAEKLTALTGMEQIFMGNSGGEANEAAIKLARLYGHQQGVQTPTIIVIAKVKLGLNLYYLALLERHLMISRRLKLLLKIALILWRCC
jgi:acetylornithine aminotransferase